MKANENKKSKRQTITVDSLQQFKELYFPSKTALEKRKSQVEDESDNYGTQIAMSILDGIKKDLSALRK